VDRPSGQADDASGEEGKSEPEGDQSIDMSTKDIEAPDGIETAEEAADVKSVGVLMDDNTADAEELPPKKKLIERPLCEQLRSAQFWGLFCFFSLVLLAVQYYVATVEVQLEEKGDDDHTYTKIFNLMFSLGGLATPLAGYLMDVHGFHASFGVCVVCLCIACGVGLCESLEAQIVTFLFITLARFLLFASFFSYVPANFGFKTFGTVLGIISVGAAVVGLLQTLLTQLSIKTWDKNFVPVNIGFSVLAVVVVAWPIWLARKKTSSL